MTATKWRVMAVLLLVATIAASHGIWGIAEAKSPKRNNFLYVQAAPLRGGTQIGVHAFALGSDGELTPVAGSPFTGPVSNYSFGGGHVFGMAYLRRRGILVVGGTDLASWRVEDDGSLTLLDTIRMNAAGNAAISVAAYETSSRAFVYTTTSFEKVLRTFSIAEDGTFTLLEGPEFSFDESPLTELSIARRTLLANDRTANAMRAFRIARNGALTEARGSPLAHDLEGPNVLVGVSPNGRAVYAQPLGTPMTTAQRVSGSGRLSDSRRGPFEIVPIHGASFQRGLGAFCARSGGANAQMVRERRGRLSTLAEPQESGITGRPYYVSAFDRRARIVAFAGVSDLEGDPFWEVRTHTVDRRSGALTPADAAVLPGEHPLDVGTIVIIRR